MSVDPYYCSTKNVQNIMTIMFHNSTIYRKFIAKSVGVSGVCFRFLRTVGILNFVPGFDELL